MVPEENPGQHKIVLLRGVVDPAGEHPVKYLVVARALHLGHPPDAPFRDGADLPLPVPAHGAVEERFAERGGHSFQDLLHLVREGGVVQDDHHAWLERVVVEEGLVAHRPLEPEPLGDLAEDGGEDMALPLPALPGDGDVQSIGIDHRAGGEGEEETLGHGLVADVVQAAAVQHRLQGVAGAEDLVSIFQSGIGFQCSGVRTGHRNWGSRRTVTGRSGPGR